MLWPTECNWFLGISSWEHLSCRLSSLEAWHHNSAMRSTSLNCLQALRVRTKPLSWAVPVGCFASEFCFVASCCSYCLHFASFLKGFLQGTSCLTVYEGARLLFFPCKWILKGSLTNTSKESLDLDQKGGTQRAQGLCHWEECKMSRHLLKECPSHANLCVHWSCCCVWAGQVMVHGAASHSIAWHCMATSPKVQSSSGVDAMTRRFPDRGPSKTQERNINSLSAKDGIC